jgi:hypothetical protein
MSEPIRVLLFAHFKQNYFKQTHFYDIKTSQFFSAPIEHPISSHGIAFQLPQQLIYSLILDAFQYACEKQCLLHFHFTVISCFILFIRKLCLEFPVFIRKLFNSTCQLCPSIKYDELEL